MHQVDRRGGGEDLLALQEERPQLRVEEREALVDLDLRLVRLDLREVGVERHVQRQIGGHAVLDAQAHLAQRASVPEAAGAGVERAGLQARERGQELEVAAPRQTGQAFEDPHLRQLSRDVGRDGRPDQRLGLLADVAADLEAPAVHPDRGSRRIAQALERDGHLRRPPVLDEAPACFEQRVPGEIAADAESGGEGPAARAPAAPACSAPPASSATAARSAARPPDAAAAPRRRRAGVHDGVVLHAVSVHGEQVGALLIAERVEQHRHAVVGPPLVALRPGRPDDAGVGVVRVEGDVEVVAVVGEPDLRRLRGRGALHRTGLHEPGDRRDGRPDRIVETPVDARRPGGPHRHGASTPVAGERDVLESLPGSLQRSELPRLRRG